MAFDQADTSVNDNPVDNGTNSQPGDTANPAATPEAIKLTNDSLIHPEGSEKPVKLSEYTRGFQSQFTKASQEAARFRQEAAQLRQELQRREQAQRQSQPQQPQGDPYAEIRQLPYLTGAETADLVQGIAGQVRQRDQFLLAALQEIKSLKQIVGGLHESHSETSFNSLIERVCSDLGYGPEAHDIAKEIYLAYTGDDLNAEFPRLLGDRMAQLEKFFDSRKRAALEKARQQPFVPGRGGDTRPNNPLKLNPNASAAEVADAIWKRRGGPETT